jgi:hypothetical protein
VVAGERTKTWQGSKWIWPTTRIAIYHRDGFRCSWCNRHVSELALCLDHLTRVADGGTHHASNLATSCFVFWDRPPTVVRDVVVRAREESLDRAWARQVVKEKPSWLKALRKRASTAWQSENPMVCLDWPGEPDDVSVQQERPDQW